MNDPTSDQTPNDRATTFQALQGPQPEHYSGELLLVCAYAAVWVILLVWVASSWRRLSMIHRRLDELEAAIAVTSKTGARPSP